MFDRLMDAARKGGWSAIYTAFAEGETTTEAKPYAVYERPARRRTLAQFLDKRPDLRALLDNAAQERRDRLLSALEDEVEKIALGAGDVTQDFDAKTGALTRTRVDRRNKLHALLKLLGSHDPDTYAERRKVDATLSGQVNHAHAHLSVGSVPAGFVIEPARLEALEPDERATLMRLIVKMQEVRHDPPALPPGGQA